MTYVPQCKELSEVTYFPFEDKEQKDMLIRAIENYIEEEN